MKNESGTADASVRVTFEKPKTPMPTVSISMPRDRSETTNLATDFSAQTQNVSVKDNISLTINGKSITNFDWNARTGAVPFYHTHGWTTLGEEFDIPTVGPHFRMWMEVAARV